MHGIGGRTIAEAQERISYPEYLKWLKFRRKRGSLHTGMRIEYGTAMLATMYANTHSKDGGHKIYEFMPHEEEPVLTLDQALDSWA